MGLLTCSRSCFSFGSDGILSLYLAFLSREINFLDLSLFLTVLVFSNFTFNNQLTTKSNPEVYFEFHLNNIVFHQKLIVYFYLLFEDTFHD